jgi:hypothetical protein
MTHQLRFDMTLPAPTSVPSLASSSMLVSINIGCFNTRRKDKKVSKDIARDNYVANEKLVSANKTLLASPKLDAIRSLITRIHEVNRNMTNEWAPKLQLLPTSVYPDHVNTFMGDASFEGTYWGLVQDFVDNEYSWVVMNMQRELGAMYDAAQYPSVEEVRKKFYYNVSYMPLTDSSNWQLDLEREAQSALQEHYERQLNNKVQSMAADLHKRIYEALAGNPDRPEDKGLIGNLATDYDDKTGALKSTGRLHDSRIENIHSLIKLLGPLNITNDPIVARAQRQLQRTLDNLTCAADFKHPEVRKDTAAKLQEVLDSLPSLDW